MQTLREIEKRIFTHGSLRGHDLELLRSVLYADGKIDRREADFLVELNKRVPNRTPAFRQFFYKAPKDHLLVDGRISAGEAAWLRQVLFAGDHMEDEARTNSRRRPGRSVPSSRPCSRRP
jgi:hypothetical protein